MAPTAPVPTQAGMFHTFQGVTPRKQSTDSQDSSKSVGHSASKRVTTPHACAECKRRKIRCDGQQPCGQCLSSRAPKRCFYDKHRQRVIPSRKTLEALSKSLEECRSILKRLYPNQEVHTLLPLSRQELLARLDRPAGDANVSALPSPPLNTPPMGDDLQSPMCLKSERTLSSLEQIPTRDTEWDEERRGHDPIPAEADDVNALSLSVDRQTSYLGASSIKAALMVMLKVQPALRNTLAAAPIHNGVEISHNMTPLNKQQQQQQQQTQSRNQQQAQKQQPANKAGTSTAVSTARKEPQRVPWSWKGQTLIDAYFKRIHAFIPMLDETAFRADYLEGQRTDAPWLALLNMVFAMGSVAGTKSEDTNHFNYYNRAMEHLPMDAFGSSHIETVQALAIVGGYYLHYINRPNMANAVLGAAIRMASALGLHRESLAHGGNADVAAAETRRRTWWSLFCLDTWATTTMGRPSFGRWGPAINIQSPEFGIAAGRDSTQHAGILPLIENIKFCKIATQIQDMLAISPLLRTEDRCSLDAQLLGWCQGLPWLLRTTDPCAEPLYIARCIMKWRYQNLRMLLHRPVLLGLASSGQTHAPESEIAAVETCRELAKQTIEDISREWSRNQMSGWNAVWFIYQAAMVPLVSIFWQWSSPRVPEWHKQIESVLTMLEAMEEWSLAARRSREVVWRMYEASRQPGFMQHQQQQQRQAAALVHADTPHLSPHDTSAMLHHQQQQQQQLQQHQLALGDQSHGLMLTTAIAAGSATSDTESFHMSPIGFESEMGMLGMLDQQGLLDLDGMFWGQAEEDEFAAAAAAAAAVGVPYHHNNVHDNMIPMDYNMMNNHAAGAFSFVH
ncbi:fungal specific transcription factor domain-containing protein [Niveomyces insectorum RCEF 264]|uniref:Fungal specific transcription factor domain-containing protein n=1 Tax=Niveomyces insectorum RCEF 264 TaxID=1081102 RepID=A0A167PIP5_9HYPO|nr:fungal specific transcription factor domain-containing protein [Niveomyces insectorum RCEF 264]